MDVAIDGLRPVYPISIAADLVGLTPRILREYEKAGFIKPARVNGKRRFSNNEVQYIKAVAVYLREFGTTLAGLRLLFIMAPCWEIKNCQTVGCPAYGDYRQKCWEAIKGQENCDALLCQACPIHLVDKKRKNMKFRRDINLGPTCFINNEK